LTFERDLAFFDLEATGVDTQRDRIVQVAVIRLSPTGTRTRWSTLVNPECPIPPEAIAVHHITDAMAAKAPRFKDVAAQILEKLEGADLGGFGAARYDIPLLSAEFQRAGLSFPLEGRRVFDAQAIFHKMEPRNLTAAYALYCGKSLENAHDASADAEASLDVFLAQLERYKDRLPAEAAALHEFCAPGDPARNVDSGGKFVWRHGEAAFNFGKHRTRTLQEVVKTDRNYVEWVARTKDMGEAADICWKALQGSFPKKGS